MTRTLFARLERILIGVILLALVGMFQSWSIELHARSFLGLLFATLAYIILIHLPVEEVNEPS